MSAEILSLLMFVVACLALLLGFPVAFTLGGVALIFAALGDVLGFFNLSLLQALPNRYFGIMNNELLVAVPLFVFMGLMLERAKIAENLLMMIGQSFGKMRGGLGIAVIFVGMLLAASTGIVGATVVTMGLLSLPAMMRAGYDPKIATGVICASGTLGQVIPPSIVLILLGDVIQGAYGQAQMAIGNWSPDPVSVVDLFAGAIIPGFVLVVLYMLWLLFYAWLKPGHVPALEIDKDEAINWRMRMDAIVMPIGLIFVVLGSILCGIATPTEGAAIGAFGAMILALFQKELSRANMTYAMQETVKMTAMVFAILLGASIFSLVFRGLGGDDYVAELLSHVPGGKWGAVFAVMALMFVMGFFLDFIEIIFVVVPIIGPVLLQMDISPVWLAVMIAVNLQTSFLTPPFGFALFYLRGVADKSIQTSDIYKGVIPFVIIQLFMLVLLACFPQLATWLPSIL